jgi:hypothetical protein
MWVVLDNLGEMWFVQAAMRPSGLNDSFEGRVLSRATPMIDFRLLAPRLSEGAEESVLFVRPPEEADDIEYDVDLEAEGIGLSPIPRPPIEAPAARLARLSTPGAHWLVAPPTLPVDDPRVSGSYTRTGASEAWEDDNTLTLPVIPLVRRRRVDPGRAASHVVGEGTEARATRLSLLLAAVFAVLSFRALGGRAPSFDELTAMGSDAPAVEARTSGTSREPVVSVPRVVIPVAKAPAPVVIRADSPISIIAPARRAPVREETPQQESQHPLGLPRPAPAPRAEVARL